VLEPESFSALRPPAKRGGTIGRPAGTAQSCARFGSERKKKRNRKIKTAGRRLMAEPAFGYWLFGVAFEWKRWWWG
jgi:hypothetical protein